MWRNLQELWRFRVLIWSLVSRHLNARYRGSFFGFFWSFLNPLCLIAVYALVFRYYIRFNQVENYALFVFVGLLPWLWFSTAVLEATSAINSGGHLITKAMFPPHVLPVVAILTHLANYLFAIPLLFLFMFYSNVPVSWSLIALPLVIFLELVLLTGLSLGLSALNVHFRDIQHILGNLLTLLFFLCPILYPVTVIPERFQFTLWLNPVALFTTMYQDIFFRGEFPGALPLLTVSGFAIVAFALGNWIFNQYRESFAELV